MELDVRRILRLRLQEKRISRYALAKKTQLNPRTVYEFLNGGDGKQRGAERRRQRCSTVELIGRLLEALDLQIAPISHGYPAYVWREPVAGAPQIDVVGIRETNSSYPRLSVILADGSNANRNLRVSGEHVDTVRKFFDWLSDTAKKERDVDLESRPKRTKR